ncbi:hypothetical protein ACHQM5_011931 [Ranunculus cassubicifolius]
MEPLIRAVGSSTNTHVLYDSPIQSNLEANLRQLLLKLTTDGKITGVQVCAYKDGEVVIDSVAGVLGEDDPRPVQHDSLFSVFSATKGITAGMLHRVIDDGYVYRPRDKLSIIFTKHLHFSFPLVFCFH